MRIAVVTLFPLMLRDALAHGVLGRALERGVVQVDCFDPREHTADAAMLASIPPYRNCNTRNRVWARNFGEWAARYSIRLTSRQHAAILSDMVNYRQRLE